MNEATDCVRIHLLSALLLNGTRDLVLEILHREAIGDLLLIGTVAFPPQSHLLIVPHELLRRIAGHDVVGVVEKRGQFVHVHHDDPFLERRVEQKHHNEVGEAALRFTGKRKSARDRRIKRSRG